MKRWEAVITYRTDNGLIDVPHMFEEFDELGVLVENGPDWNAIDHVDVRLIRRSLPDDYTVEDAETR